jgi:catechol 2,3-dioxygenase-like lactoylglutathione lyase family enzyme
LSGVNRDKVYNAREGWMPKLNGVLETALYVDDMDRARAFYSEALGLTPLFSDQRLTAFDAGNRTVLLLFLRGSTLQTVTLPGGTIPPHDGAGPLHVAFSIAAADLPAWEARLAELQVAIEGRTNWPRGGVSVYFRDPDGHLLELATPGLWATS